MDIAIITLMICTLFNLVVGTPTETNYIMPIMAVRATSLEPKVVPHIDAEYQSAKRHSKDIKRDICDPGELCDSSSPCPLF